MTHSPFPVTIRSVDVEVVRGALPEPIRFGSLLIEYRDFALVRLTVEGGAAGYAFTLTRNGPVAEAVRLLRGSYVGQTVGSPEIAFKNALRANPMNLSGGVGSTGTVLGRSCSVGRSHQSGRSVGCRGYGR